MKYRQQPDIPEGINTSHTHPLKEFAFLLTMGLGLVLALSLLIVFSIDWLAERVPYSLEQSMVSTLDQKFSERNAVDDYLQSIADKLKPAMGLPDEAQIRVHYVDDETVNAMTTLGGHIFVYRGLLKKLQSENAIAMLLAHEMAHVKFRHPIKGLGKGVVLSAVFSLIMGQASDVSAQVISRTGSLTLLKFSRDQEQASDELALKAVQQIYHHVNGAEDLFKNLQDKGNGTAEFLSSHPDTLKRIAYLQQLAKQQGWPVEGDRIRVPENIRRLVF